MTGATLFSGIGAPEVAMPWVDWRWCAEIDRFCSAVLAHRHPQVPNLGDVTAHDFIDRAKGHGPVDLVVFGSPCQSFSVAGKRLGLDDPRGNLALVALGVVDRLRPAWFLFENVHGLLSSDDGRDYAAFVGAVEDVGYHGCWGTLDAQWFGLAQRRERVFFVGHAGDWRYAAAVLSEFACLSGHPAPSREKGEGITHDLAPSIGASGRGFERTGESRGQDPLVAVFGGNKTSGPVDVATACNAHGGVGRMDFESETFVAHLLRGDGFDANEDGTGRDASVIPILEAGGRTGKSTTDPRAGTGIGEVGDPMYTLQRGKQHAVAFSCKDQAADAGELAPTLRAMSHDRSHANTGGGSLKAGEDGTGRGTPLVPWMHQGMRVQNPDGVADALTHNPAGGTRINPVLVPMAVRRLTPRECERLQGFPDDYTLIPTYRKKAQSNAEEMLEYYHRTEEGRRNVLMRDGKLYATPDGPRYRALGNSMAVPVVRWIGERIRWLESAKLVLTGSGPDASAFSLGTFSETWRSRVAIGVGLSAWPQWPSTPSVSGNTACGGN